MSKYFHRVLCHCPFFVSVLRLRLACQANLACSGNQKYPGRIKAWEGSVSEAWEWKESGEGRKVFLREMCLQGNFAKSGLCSFSFTGKKKPSSFFSLILPIIFSYCPCYITSQLSSEADPVEYLSLHWWIARVLWADLDGGGISLHPLWGREKEGQGRYEPERSVSTFPSCHGNGWGWPTFFTMLGFACLKYQQVTYFLELGWDSENT